MKRVLTKKPQFSKTVLPERQKRNLKFTHTAVETGVLAGPQVLDGPVEMDQTVYEWAQAEEAAPAVIEQQSRSLFQTLVAIVLPIIGIAVVAAAVAAAAQSAGYDWTYITSRLN
ncbi:MAG: hypothetical protein QM667_00725 [Asticcacaulis sp.]